MPKRTKQGTPIWGRSPLRAADAIALLSGVNYGSVEKVICAMFLIEEHLNLMPEDLTKYADVPLQAVNPSIPEFAERANAALKVCTDIARDEEAQRLGSILNLRNRFRGPTNSKS